MAKYDWLVQGPIVALVFALCLPAVPVIGTLLDNPNALRGSSSHDYDDRCAQCLAFASGETEAEPEDWPRYCEPEQPDWCNLAAQYRSAAAAESSRRAAWSAAFLTLFGVCLLYCTLRATQETLGQAIEATEQAKLATKAAEKTNTTTLKVGTSQSRAYIDAFEVRIYENSPNKLSIHIKNTGDTPAKAFGIICHSARFDEYPIRWFDHIQLEGERITFWSALGSGETTSINHEPKIGNLVMHSYGAVCIKGAVVYRTIFDEDIYSEFAFVRPPGGIFDKRETVFIDGAELDTAYTVMIKPSTKQPLKTYEIAEIRLPNSRPEDHDRG